MLNDSIKLKLQNYSFFKNIWKGSSQAACLSGLDSGHADSACPESEFRSLFTAPAGLDTAPA